MLKKVDNSKPEVNDVEDKVEAKEISKQKREKGSHGDFQGTPRTDQCYSTTFAIT